MNIEEICEKARSLPASPSIVPALLELLGREDADLKDLEAIIRRDTSLSAAVLRMANSAYYGGHASYADLSQALLHLGFSRTYELVLTVSGGRWNTFDLEGYSWEPGDFFRHSLTVAVVAKEVALQIGYEQPELAYVAGLIHEAGKLALAYACPDQIEQVRQEQSASGDYWMDAEQRVLGFTHTDISKHLLQQWHFPESLIFAAAYYPNPEESDQANRKLVQIIHLAKHLTVQMGIGNGEDAFWLPVHEKVLADLSLAEADLELILERSLEAAQKILRQSLLTGKVKL